MATTSLGGAIPFGWSLNDSIARQDYLIDASGEKVAFIFRVPKSGNIDRVSFRTQTVSSSQTLRVGLETLDGSGDPSGTQYGGSAVGTQASPATATTYEVTLATPASATVGDYVAAVIQFDSTAGNLNIAGGSQSGLSFQSTHYTNHYTTSWTKQSRQSMLSIRYDDGTYAPLGQMPPCVFNSATYNSGSTPDERAQKMILAVAMQVNGMYAYLDQDNACDLVLYNSGGTALETVSLTAANRQSVNPNYAFAPFAPRELAAGTYYMSIKPTSVSSIVAYHSTFLAANHQQALPGGTNVYLSTRTDAGAWTDDTTSRLYAGLLVTGVETPGGSGGMRFHPGMQGCIVG